MNQVELFLGKEIENGYSQLVGQSRGHCSNSFHHSFEYFIKFRSGSMEIIRLRVAIVR